MKIIIVDQTDKPIGLKQYSSTNYDDIYRVAALNLIDESTGDILIAQRNFTKHIDPGKWSGSAAGTIEENETYDSNIVKETEEELGLSGLKFIKGPKEFIDDGQHKFFVQWFIATVDKNKVKLTLEEDEVAAIRWVTPDKLIADIQKHPEVYTPHFFESMKALGL